MEGYRITSVQVDDLTFVSMIIVIQIRHGEIAYPILININHGYTLTIDLQFFYCDGTTIDQINVAIADYTNIIIACINSRSRFLCNDLSLCHLVFLLYGCYLHVLISGRFFLGNLVGVDICRADLRLYTLGKKVLLFCRHRVPFFRGVSVVDVPMPTEHSTRTEFCTGCLESIAETLASLYRCLLKRLFTRLDNSRHFACGQLLGSIHGTCSHQNTSHSTDGYWLPILSDNLFCIHNLKSIN